MNKKIIIGLVMALIVGAQSLIRAEDKPKKNWKNDTEFSLVSTNGNSRTQSTSGKNTFTDKWGKTALELIGGGMGNKDKGVTTAEKYFASEKVDYSLTERNYLFQKTGWNKDRFSGINNRIEANAGLGRDIVKRPSDLLTAELGGGYINEDRIGSPRNDFGSGRAYSKYVHTLSPTSNFSQDAEYLHDFNNKKDFRVNTETALTAALSVHFSLKLSYKWNYVGVPPKGFGRSDTTTLMSLIASY